MVKFKVLVTGGAGFIGSHVVDKLVAEGCEVVVLDDLSSGRIGNIEEHVAWNRVRLVEGSVLDGKLVAGALDGVDAVVHLAAIVSVPFSMAYPDVTRETNVAGTKVVIDHCPANAKFVYASSCAVYGEAIYVPIDEAHSTDPMSPYAESKLVAERMVLASGGEKLAPVALRFFNVYGPRQVSSDYAGVITVFKGNLLAKQPLMIYGDGSQTRDFVYVGDVADSVWLALTGKCEGIYNICSGDAVTIKQLAEVMAELAGVKDCEMIHGEPRVGDIRHSHGTYGKANKAFGFKPAVDLRSGLARLMKARQRPA